MTYFFYIRAIKLIFLELNEKNLVYFTYRLQPLTADESTVTSYGTHWRVFPSANMWRNDVREKKPL